MNAQEMTGVVAAWTTASKELGIEVVAPFRFVVGGREHEDKGFDRACGRTRPVGRYAATIERRCSSPRPAFWHNRGYRGGHDHRFRSERTSRAERGRTSSDPRVRNRLVCK
jgi:hypothetical protein